MILPPLPEPPVAPPPIALTEGDRRAEEAREVDAAHAETITMSLVELAALLSSAVGTGASTHEEMSEKDRYVSQNAVINRTIESIEERFTDKGIPSRPFERMTKSFKDVNTNVLGWVRYAQFLKRSR